MNTEKINAAAEEYALEVHSQLASSKMLNASICDFTAGVHFAAENLDVINCVTVEEAMRFAEWVFKEGWKFPSEYEPDKWFKLAPDDEGLYGVNKVFRKTTAELFDIFKKQKP